MSQGFCQERLVELVGRLCDQEISDGEVGELEGLLKEHAEARQLYHLTVALHRDLESCEIIGRPSSGRPANTVPSRHARSGFASPHGRLALGVCILLILGLVGYNTFLGVDDPAETTILATVTDLVDVEWRGNDSRLHVGDRVSIGRLQVTSGTVCLTYEHGVVVTVEGPADYEIQALDHAVLHEGQLVAYVPDGAEGFRVSTEGTDVVDLGTEFGVTARQDGSLDVIVFDGEVELAPKNDSRAGQQRIAAGLAYRVDVDGRTHRREFRQTGFEEARSILRRRKVIREPFRRDELFPGTARNGWTGPWELTSENLAVSDHETGIRSNNPLASDSRNYLTIAGQSGADGPPGRLGIQRGFESYDQFDSTQPYTVEFLFRLESDPAAIERIEVFGVQAPADPDNDRTDWRVGTPRRAENDDLRWQLYRPQATSTKTLPLVQGHIYRFLIEVDPRHLRWRASVSDGTRTIWNTIRDGAPLRLRSGMPTDQNVLGWELSVASGSELQFSLDAVFIQNNPTATLESER